MAESTIDSGNAAVMPAPDSPTPEFQQVIPVYPIHDLSHPFCLDPKCECHENEQMAAHVLSLVDDGLLTVHEANNLLEGKSL